MEEQFAQIITPFHTCNILDQNMKICLPKKHLSLVGAFHHVLDLCLARALARLCLLGTTLLLPVATLPVCRQQTCGLAFIEFSVIEQNHSMSLALCDTAPSASPLLHRASLPPAPPSRVRQKGCCGRGGSFEFCCGRVVQHAFEPYYQLPGVAWFPSPLKAVSVCLQHPSYHHNLDPYRHGERRLGRHPAVRKQQRIFFLFIRSPKV